MSAVNPIPEGYASAIPYLIVRGAAEAIDFYKSVFGATEVMRYPAPDGKIGHAEVKIGNALFMLADEYPEMGHKAPQAVGGSPVSVMVYVDNVDALTAKAKKSGAKILRPLADQFYGDRSCTLEDPFGHIWHFATHKEDVSPEEMHRRMNSRETQTA
jgi:PhnB protein